MFKKIRESENSKPKGRIFFEATIYPNGRILLNSDKKINHRIKERLLDAGIEIDTIFDSPCG